MPVKLLDALERHAQSTGARPLFVQLSTDQVYAGTRCSKHCLNFLKSGLEAHVDVTKLLERARGFISGCSLPS